MHKLELGNGTYVRHRKTKALASPRRFSPTGFNNYSLREPASEVVALSITSTPARCVHVGIPSQYASWCLLLQLRA